MEQPESSLPYSQAPATRLVRDASSRNTPPPRRSQWGSILPPDCFVSRGGISPVSNSQHFVFHGEELLAPRPTPPPTQLEDHPLSAGRDCLFNIFAAALHIGGRSSIRNLRTRHGVLTGTHTHTRSYKINIL
jgi:hypothetical protein